MTEVSEMRAHREIWNARKNPAPFTPAQEFRIRKVYESKVRNKDEFMHLRLKGNAYEFAYYGKKNRHLCCPETRFEFFSNGYCVMTKDNAQGTSKERKYYLF